MRNCKSAVAVVVGALLAVVGTSSSANAHIRTLGDRNSTVSINTDTSGNRVGMDGWQVDGTNHLYNQWFWFRVGSSGPESRINSLPELSVNTFNTNSDPRDDTYNVVYGSLSTFTIDVTFRLSGGLNGSNSSDIVEQIRIDNHTNQVLPFHFFQYCDFDLSNDIVDDSVIINPNNTATQRDGNLAVAETVVSPMPNNREAGVYSATINRLDNAGFDDLNGEGGGGPGFDDGTRRDYTWAFQWDRDIAAFGTFQISKDKNFIPAPGALGLLGLGGLLTARRRRN